MELMVVLALIGIMTAMIIPQMKGTYQDALLRSSGRKLVDSFGLASSRAITMSQPHRVRLDEKKGCYFVERTAPEREKGTNLTRLSDIPGGHGEIDQGITMEIRKLGGDSSETPGQGPAFASDDDLGNRKKSEVIGFYPDGTADAAEIVLRDRDGFRLGLRLNPTTARVHILELERQ